MDPTARHEALLQVQGNYPTEILEKDSIAYNTLESIHAMKAIQAKMGKKAVIVTLSVTVNQWKMSCSYLHFFACVIGKNLRWILYLYSKPFPI